MKWLRVWCLFRGYHHMGCSIVRYESTGTFGMVRVTYHYDCLLCGHVTEKTTIRSIIYHGVHAS